MKVKTGFLFPPSKMYPLLAKEVLDGFRYVMEREKAADKVEVIYRNISNHEQPAVFGNDLQNLFLQENAQSFVAFISNDLLHQVQSGITAFKKPFTVANLGAKLPKLNDQNESINEHALITDFSLEPAGCTSMAIAGDWAARNLGKKLAIGTYFYESGFDFTYSFVEGFVHGGGEVVAPHVASLNPDPNDFEVLMAKIQQYGADVLWVNYSERDAVAFFRKFKEADLNVPVICGDKMFQRYILDQLDFVPTGVYSCATWFEQESGISEAVKGFEEATGSPVTWFSRMGIQIGTMYAKALQDDTIKPDNGVVLAQKLKEALQVQPTLPFRIVKTEEHNGQILYNTCTEIDLTKEQHLVTLLQDIVAKHGQIQTSGWSHAYLVN